MREEFAMITAVTLCTIGGVLTMGGFCMEPAFVSGNYAGSQVMFTGIMMMISSFIFPVLSEIFPCSPTR